MKDRERTKKITGIAILTALVVVLQLIANYVQFAVSINLSLIPIVIGAILYGPFAGLFLGFVNGIIVMTAPSTLTFFNINPVMTVFTCLLKTGLAGLFSGYVYKLFSNKKEKVGALIATIIAPLTNTLIFSIFCILFFKEFLNMFVTDDLPNIYSALFLGVIGVNFLIEFSVNLLLSNAVYTIIKIKKKEIVSK